MLLDGKNNKEMHRKLSFSKPANGPQHHITTVYRAQHDR
jgi:hypothetical protein